VKSRRRIVAFVALVVLAAVVAEAAFVARRLHAFEPREKLETPPVVMEFSADGSVLLVTSRERYFVYDPTNPLDMRFGARRSRTGEGSFEHLSPDGRHLLHLPPWTKVPEKEKYTLELRDLETGEDVWWIRCDDVPAFDFSPDGRRFVYSGSGSLHVCRAPDGKEELALPRSEPIECAAYSPDGAVIARGGRWGAVRIEASTRDETVAVTTGDGASSLRFSPDGRVLVVIDRDIAQAYKASSGGNFWTTPVRLFRVEFTRDGSYLVGAVAPDGGKLHVLDARTGREVGTSRGEFSSFALSPDGESIALGHADGKIEIAGLARFLAGLEPAVTGH